MQDETIKPNDKILALAKHLEVSTADIEESSYNSDSFMVDDEDGSEYLVLTDSEADTAWEEALDNYIDEVILPEISDAYRFYFDDEKWKSAARMDGRGHSLATYDSEENEEEIDGTTYYIYRTN